MIDENKCSKYEYRIMLQLINNKWVSFPQKTKYKTDKIVTLKHIKLEIS